MKLNLFSHHLFLQLIRTLLHIAPLSLHASNYERHEISLSANGLDLIRTCFRAPAPHKPNRRKADRFPRILDPESKSPLLNVCTAYALLISLRVI